MLVVDPALSTRLVVVPAVAEAEPLEPLVIHAVGDVIANESVVAGESLPLRDVTELLSNDTLTLANIACHVGESAGPEDPTCDPGLFADLAAAGIDVGSLANDEAPFAGRAPLRRTIVALTEAGVEPVGAGTDEGSAYAPVFVEAQGWRIAVLAMTAVGANFAEGDRAGTAAVERTEQATEAIIGARDGADLVIVSVHWGRPLDRDAERRDRAYADALIAAGADAIVGHGPHRLQSFALVEERPVFWSLGHFLWPVVDPADADSAIARLEISPDGTLVTCLVPVTIDVVAGPQLDRLDPSCAAQ